MVAVQMMMVVIVETPVGRRSRFAAFAFQVYQVEEIYRIRRFISVTFPGWFSDQTMEMDKTKRKMGYVHNIKGMNQVVAITVVRQMLERKERKWREKRN